MSINRKRPTNTISELSKQLSDEKSFRKLIGCKDISLKNLKLPNGKTNEFLYIPKRNESKPYVLVKRDEYKAFYPLGKISENLGLWRLTYDRNGDEYSYVVGHPQEIGHLWNMLRAWKGHAPNNEIEERPNTSPEMEP